MSNLKLRNISSWLMFIFGILAFLLGFGALIKPEFQLSILGLKVVDPAQRPDFDYTLSFITAAAMAAVNMGIYYILAALHNLKPFYRWTVPFRCVTFVVFMLAASRGIMTSVFIPIGIWELVGAITTGLALAYEDRRHIP